MGAVNGSTIRPRRGRGRRLGAAGLLTALASVAVAVLPASVATAATDTVTNCSGSASDPGSLPYEVANAVAGDTIAFALPSACTTIAPETTIAVTVDLTITGPGARTLDVSGGGEVEPFFVDGGVTASISGLTIDNGSAFDGGGIYNVGTLTLTDCTVTNNETGESGSGGGIYNLGTLTVTDSTLSDNTADSFGGAIESNQGSLDVTNSTFAGNSTNTDAGGGIDMFDGSATITNSTFSDNSAPSYLGGGIEDDQGQLSIGATIFAGSPSGNDCFLQNAPFTDLGSNLSDDTSCSFTDETDQQNTAAGLDPSGPVDNGGETPTIALTSQSAAIDAVSSPSLCPATDQRGATRTSPCDIGAYDTDWGSPVAVAVSGSQTYGSAPDLTFNADAPAETVTGTLACTTVDGGTPISPTLAVGTHTIDGSSCSGLSSSDPADFPVFPSSYGGTPGAFVVTPSVTAVTFTGSVASPTVTVSGSGFGTSANLGPAQSSCDTGSNHADNLFLSDTTDAWTAGEGAPAADDCIGLLISSYSDTTIVFTFGSEYGVYPVDSGVALLSGGDNYTIHVLGTTQSGTVAYPNPPNPPTITTTSLPGGLVNHAYSQPVSATGGTTPYTWSISAGSLPAGLGIDASTGVISGSPTTPGTATFTVKVADATTPTPQTDTRSLSISVPTVPVITTAFLALGTVNGSYSQPLSATGGTTPYTWSISAGSLPAGLGIDASTGVISGAPTTPGTSHFTVKVTDATTPTPQTATRPLSISVPTVPAITTASLPAGTLDQAYAQPVSATGGTTPYTWSISAGSLPAGLGINASTGVISGGPTAPGTSTFTVAVTDATGLTPQTATRPLSITITGFLTVTTTSLPGATAGQAYSATLAATGGTAPYAWSVSSGPLPAGLKLDSSTGVISGSPTTDGSVGFGVKVTDSSPVPEHDSAALSITTQPAAPVVSKLSPPTGDSDGGTSVTITGSGFTGATQVVFGDSGALDVSVVNDTTITATSPHEPVGTVDVVVTTPAGNSVVNPADEFTYTAQQPPVTVSCDPTCSAVASSPLNDTTVTVTGTTGTAGSTVTLGVNTDVVACNSSHNYLTAVSTLSASGFPPGSLLTVQELIANEPSTQGVKVCYLGSGATAGQFLRPCRRGHVPCLVSLTEVGGSVLVTFLVPANDPRFWVGGAPLSLKAFTPIKAAPGATVTLKGKNLTGVVSVVMGGARATIVSVTPTKLVVTVPPDAVTGLISVTAASGTATSPTPLIIT